MKRGAVELTCFWGFWIT